MAIAVLLFCGMAMQTRAATAGLTSSGALPALSQHAVAGRAQRTLTLEERVSYQRAIEEVYWRHRIWPKENANPKPSLDAVMSLGQLEKKVTDYLRNSQALADYWRRPITTDQLQSEMDRMAQNTKQPQVLQELFEALGNDPFVIAECLAKPVLAERLLAHPKFERVKQPSRTFDHTIAGHDYSLPTISDPSVGCIGNTWTATSLTNVPAAREYYTAVWTGTEMIVWGGYNGSNLNTGGRYNPSTDSWTATSTANAPSPRYGHTAVWTGSEMIVWAGTVEPGGALNSGGRYNPTTDSWIATSFTDAPSARSGHTAVWTGSEMIVWGGGWTSLVNTGGKYNPNTNSWTATNTFFAPSSRAGHTAVWTGSEMIVWGGSDGSEFTPDPVTGGRYNPSTDYWTATSIANVPAARSDHTAVWTGTEMIVWGGLNDDAPFFGIFNDGGKYNPSTNSWTATSINNAPEARYDHTAIWSGSEMIIWGGSGGGGPSNTGGKYNPATNNWAGTSTTNAPDPRFFHTAVWTGSEMIVWGGWNDATLFNTGGRYCVPSGPPPPTPTPTPTPPPCPGGCVVTNTNDDGPGSLRQAIALARDGDRITFTVTGVIRLTSGGLLVTKNVTISGPGANHLAVDGNQALFVFGIFPGKTAAISGLTIRNAEAGAGIWNEQGTLAVTNCVVTSNSYDGLYNHAGTLNVNNCVFSGNSYYGLYSYFGITTVSNCVVSENSSGGLANGGPQGGPTRPNRPVGGPGLLTITDSMISDNSGPGVSNVAGFLTVLNSTFSGNSAGQASDGGGIMSGPLFKTPADVRVINSTISSNSASDFGGGISGGWWGVSVINSTISGNSSGESGGGIRGTFLTITNSTISGNSAGNNGGGIASYGHAVIANSTLSGNSAGSGGGIYNYGNGQYGPLEISNSILNGGPLGENIFNDGGTVTSHGYNISSDNGSGYLNSPGDQINTDPLLGPLQDNGGPTLTYMPLPGSPAIDAGDPNFTPPPFRDQRGPCFHRVFGRRIDIGSVETQPQPRCPTPGPRPTPH